MRAGPDPLTSQGSLVYDVCHGLLIAVNAGSDTVSVLGVDEDHLCLRQVLASGGTFPVSVAVHGDLLYVVNAHEAGAITGYRIIDGQVDSIEGSTRSLGLTPVTGPGQFLNTPGQVGFTPDGQQLIITTKGNGSLIDVFTMGTDGDSPDLPSLGLPAGGVDRHRSPVAGGGGDFGAGSGRPRVGRGPTADSAEHRRCS